MKFEHQRFQEECVDNIISVLNDFDFESGDAAGLAESLKSFYSDSGTAVPVRDISQKLKLDVLMETGTGKTFTYLKTIFEINKQFKINKFIIFVPRKAIRQVVLQNIELTKEFFYADDKYKKYLEVYTYEGDVSSIMKGYLRNSDELSVLVLTNSSIDKDANKLRRTNEFFGMAGDALDKIKKLRPVVIIDEPHLLKGKKFTKVFETFNALYIRFGATFPREQEHKLSNAVYVLDSISAFREHLVKKISVNTVFSETDNLKLVRSDLKAKTAEFVWKKNDMESEGRILRINEDIGAATGLTEYSGVSIVKIMKDKVYFSNRREFESKNSFNLSESEMETMIGQTIKLHFEKEEKLFAKGIKELSLFFIPSVPDFRGNNPKIRNMFEQTYKKIRKEFYSKTKNSRYKKYLDRDFDSEGRLTVCEGYFSGDKGSSAEEKEKTGVDLILKDRESLLSFETPLRFIFSVWALQEGWDNPNIFNLCKLASSTSEISKRQQVGRGLRLAVNQSGSRVIINNAESENDFYEVNTLDVVVSSQEMNFIEEIQREINKNSFTLCSEYFEPADFEIIGFNKDESLQIVNTLRDNKAAEFAEDKNKYLKKPCFEAFIKDKNNREKFNFLSDEKYSLLIGAVDEKAKVENYIINGQNKQKVNIRENKLKEFRELWETINRKAEIIYRDIDESLLTDAIAKKFNEENIKQVLVRVEKKEYDPKTNKINACKEDILGLPDFFKDNKFDSFINEFRNKYPLNFIINLFNKIDAGKVKNNPKQARRILDEIIKAEIHNNIVEKVDYKFSTEIKITSLQEASGEYKKSIESRFLGRTYEDKTEVKDNYLYDKLVYDSYIERDIIINTNDPSKVGDSKVTVFAKLPEISIPTPYKKYNPDFAYLIETGDKSKKLFLIVETKGYESEKDIPNEEKKKINYAERFFKRLQELYPDIKIAYEKRINKTSLADIINSVVNHQN